LNSIRSSLRNVGDFVALIEQKRQAA
jgi:hypothetical protein